MIHSIPQPHTQLEAALDALNRNPKSDSEPFRDLFWEKRGDWLRTATSKCSSIVVLWEIIVKKSYDLYGESNREIPIQIKCMQFTKNNCDILGGKHFQCE